MERIREQDPTPQLGRLMGGIRKGEERGRTYLSGNIAGMERALGNAKRENGVCLGWRKYRDWKGGGEHPIGIDISSAVKGKGRGAGETQALGHHKGSLSKKREGPVGSFRKWNTRIRY